MEIHHALPGSTGSFASVTYVLVSGDFCSALSWSDPRFRGQLTQGGKRNMDNPIINFCLHVNDDQVGQYIRDDLKIITMDVKSSARAAMAVAELDHPDIIVVQDDGRTGLLFPAHLKNTIPHASVVQGQVNVDMSLLDMVTEIDNHGIDFHSEQINTSVLLRKCPSGHLIKTEFCDEHKQHTDEFP